MNINMFTEADLARQNEDLDFKKQLFENFKQTGIMDGMKANLRKQIVDKLQQQTQTENELKTAQKTINQQKKEEIESLRQKEFYRNQRIYAHLIADYMRTYDINYAYSIFLPEMRVNSNQILMRDEICEAFLIEKGEYKQLDGQREKLSAIEIIVEIIKQLKKAKKVNREVQTESYEKSATMGMRMDDINHEYGKKLDYLKLVSNRNVEESLAKYRKECEAKYKADLEMELQRFRDYELIEMRALEAERYQEKLNFHRKELDKVYYEKLQKLQEREKNAIELCKRRLEDLEKIQQENRQKNLNDIDAMNKKELEFRRHSCLDHIEVKEQREKLEKLEKDLKLKMREYESAKQLINTRIEEDISYRRDVLRKEQKYQELQKNDIEKQIKEEQAYINQQKQHLRNLEMQLQYLRDENDHLKKDVKELDYIKSEQYKEIQALRDQVRKHKESIEANEERLQHANKQMELLKDQIKILKTEVDQKTHSLEQRQSDQLNLHSVYTMDMERNYNKLVETEKAYSQKLENLRQQSINDNLFLKNENKELSDINLRLEDEVSNLRRELRFIRKKLQEKEGENIDPNTLNYSNTLKLSPTQTQKLSRGEKLMEEDIQNQDYRKNLDDIFQEMKSLKEKALFEFNNSLN
ncbi:hypothetical protein ABPG72_022529 [Tetrahymena utriculariae]